MAGQLQSNVVNGIRLRPFRQIFKQHQEILPRPFIVSFKTISVLSIQTDGPGRIIIATDGLEQRVGTRVPRSFCGRTGETRVPFDRIPYVMDAEPIRRSDQLGAQRVASGGDHLMLTFFDWV